MLFILSTLLFLLLRSSCDPVTT